MIIQEGVSLKRLNTFGIEVKAKRFARVESIADAQEVLSKLSGDELLILGGGSNMLFTKDQDLLVLQNCFTGISVADENEDFVWLKAGAGENWHSFVLYCIEKGFGGIENLSLIPGNVGATPMQNIGAYGVEIKETFYSLEALEIENGTVRNFTNEECRFGYRESVFKRELKYKYLIISVTFKLTKRDHRFTISYGDIAKELQKEGIGNPGLREISNAVITIRKSKLPDPAELGNAGSFFKNPVVGMDVFEMVKSHFPEVTSYPAGIDHVKLAAGYLIEKCGWKGFRKGDAGVHKKQALVLVNYGNATGKEIWDLSQNVVDDVKEKSGVELEREVNIY